MTHDPGNDTDSKMKLSINEATIILVAEILRKERGCEELPVDNAREAIQDAVKKMRQAEND